MAFSITQKVSIANTVSSVDELYGPYDSVSKALETIPAAFLGKDAFVGRHIGVKDSNGIVSDYIYQKTTDSTGKTVYEFQQATGGSSDLDITYTEAMAVLNGTN